MTTTLDPAPLLVPTTVGSVVTVLEPGRAVVWLTGEIDCAQALTMATLARHLHLFAPHVVVELSEMTFCDSTVAAFVAEVSRRVPVTVLRPPATFVELMRICDLTDRVQIANFPGPAPTRPI